MKTHSSACPMQVRVEPHAPLKAYELQVTRGVGSAQRVYGPLCIRKRLWLERGHVWIVFHANHERVRVCDGAFVNGHIHMVCHICNQVHVRILVGQAEPAVGHRRAQI